MNYSSNGLDIGSIVDGTVTLDKETGNYVLIDDDGVVFDPVLILKSLLGKKTRITIISFESIVILEDIYKQSIDPQATHMLVESDND